MTRYAKRIAFVISSQHLIVHGGIGSFAKSFVEMAAELDWKVDIIMDKCPNKNALVDYLANQMGCEFVFPDAQQVLSYAKHSAIHAFRESINLEKLINFRNAIMKSFGSRLYDMVLVNTVDAIYPIAFLGLSSEIPTVYYTHNEDLIFLKNDKSQLFNQDSLWSFRNLMQLPHVTVGTQSSFNVESIKSTFPNIKIKALPMRIPEQGLLEPSHQDKSGIMFIGRFEPRKQPKKFCDVVAQTGLPAKILTNQKGQKKFEDYFKQIGYDNYQIKSGIMGKEKVDFIKSAKLAFHTANLESFGFSAFETVHSCETFCLKEFDWWGNHSSFVRLTTMKTAVKDLIAAYECEFDESSRLTQMREWHHQIKILWKEFLENELDVLTRCSDKRSVKTELIRILESRETISLSEYFKHMGRDQIAIDDVLPILKKRHLIEFIHQDDQTMLTLNTHNRGKQ
jgi:glycosyltransferase involved in cell wall biosynthesis